MCGARGPQGELYVDDAVKGARYPAALPEMLRPTLKGLAPSQMMVYEAFARPARQPSIGGAPAAASADGAGGAGAAGAAGAGAGGGGYLEVSQAMVVYGRLVQGLEASIKQLVATAAQQSKARLVSLSMLGPDHEVPLMVRQTLEVTLKIAPHEREAASYQFARSVFKKVVEASDLLKIEAFVGILGGLREECKKLSTDILAWIGFLPSTTEEDFKLHRLVLVLLAKVKLVRVQDLDAHLAAKTSGGQLQPWVDLAMAFVRQCVAERVGGWRDFGQIFDALGKAAQRHGQGRKINKFMEELRAVASQVAASQAGQGAGEAGKQRGGADAVARDQVTYLLERWIRVWNESGGAEHKCVQYVTLLHQQNVLKTEESTEVFVRLAIELCVDACVKTAQPPPPPEDGSAASQPPPGVATQFVYNVVDALSNMLVILVKFGSADPQSVTSRAHLLGRILTAMNRVLLSDAHEKSANKVDGGSRRPFDQRPYLRILLNLVRDLNASDQVKIASHPTLRKRNISPSDKQARESTTRGIQVMAVNQPL